MRAIKYLKIIILTLALTSLAGLTFADAITVNNNSNDQCDSDGAGACTVCDTDSLTVGDQCSLRAAIKFSNLNAGSDTISFDNDYTISVSASENFDTITGLVTIDGAANTIVVEGTGDVGTIGFNFEDGSEGSSLKNLTVNQFETQIEADTVDGYVGASCTSNLTFDTLNVGTSSTGNATYNGQLVGMYLHDSKCINVNSSTIMSEKTGVSAFNNYTVRINNADHVTIDQSQIGLTKDKTTTANQRVALDASSSDNLTVKTSYLTIDDTGQIINVNQSDNFVLVDSKVGFDNLGAKLGGFSKALFLDNSNTSSTSLAELETATYIQDVGLCATSKSNICNNYFGGSTSRDVEVLGDGHYFYGNKLF